MAHKNMAQLCHLVEYFIHDCYVFIHLDKKFKMSKEERERLEAFPQVIRVYQKFDVNWGGFSMLRCQMFMMREVLKRCDAEYVHLISGQDYPTMSLDEFLMFFEQYKEKDCLQYIHLPHINWERNTYQRLQYYYPYDCFSTRYKARSKMYQILHFQRKYNIKRSLPKQFDHLYGCSQWFSITRKSTQMIVDYTRRHPMLYWRMWMTFAPEEMYTATVLVNLKKGKDILFTNFRFIRMKYENGNNPANLDVHHLRYLVERPCVFARKMEMPVSNEIIEVLDKYFVYDKQPLKAMPNGGWEYDGYKAYGYSRDYITAVVKLCQLTGVDSVLDVGCGCGMDVAILREQHIAAVGFDANPYTEELSARLIDKDQELCVQADLLDDELETESPFGLVLCKDVLPYIPAEQITKAVKKLAKLSDRYVLLNWYEGKHISALPITCHIEKDMVSMMSEVNFFPDPLLNRQLKELNMGNKKYVIFVKKNN
ncbi:MAG: methyltransferase domain-containing protein [Bacteroidaceae bacterium]|nr:methyltransferase domain-containing protein [Bacteroidaceae bacterium]